MAVLFGLGLLLFGCARVHVPLVSKRLDPDEVKQGPKRQPEDQKLSSDRSRTVGKRPIDGTKVAAVSGAARQTGATKGDFDGAGHRGSDDKSNIFAAFNRKRVSEARDDFPVDPFLPESGSSVEDVRAELARLAGDKNSQPARSSASARDRQPNLAGRQNQRLPDKKNIFADGFESELERLRAAGRQAEQKLAGKTDEHEDKQPVAELVRGRAESVRDQGTQEVASVSDRAAEFLRFAERSRRDAVDGQASSPLLEDPAASTAMIDVQTGDASPIEYLPPPPLSAPPAENPFGAMTVDTETLPGRSRGVESREPKVENRASGVEGLASSETRRESKVASRDVAAFNTPDSTSERTNWPPAVRFDGSIAPAPDRGVVTAEQEEFQLAEIVPNRRSSQTLPTAWSPQPSSTPRVMANRGSDLSVRTSTDLSPLPADRDAQTEPAEKTDFPRAAEREALEKTEANELPEAHESAEEEKTESEFEAPLPPAESRPAPESFKLQAVHWDDESQAGSRQGRAAIPSSMLFGSGVGLAFLIGLAIRRRHRLRVGQADR